MAVSSAGQSSISLGRTSPREVSRFEAIGGIESISGGYKFHTFNSSAEFRVLTGLKNFEIFLVAGGGGGGFNGGHSQGGGGGGGGGEVLETQTLAPLVKGSYNVTVGAGGAVDADGEDSSFLGFSVSGGLRGLARVGAGGEDGTGTFTGGNSSVYSGGGGAGASENGGNASIYSHVSRQYTAQGGNGGAGVSSSFSGSSIVYAGGGAGRGTTGAYSFDGVTRGFLGTHGGGNDANRGGGGNGGGAGYSGVIIVRYAI